MRVLLDEQLPRRLARELSWHDITTVQEQGWSGLKNGELLERASTAGIDVIVTKDQGIEFQQSLSRATIGVVLLVAPSNAMEDLLPLVPGTLAAIGEVQPGEVRHVGR